MKREIYAKLAGAIGLVMIFSAFGLTAHAATTIAIEYPEFTNATSPAAFVSSLYDWSLGIVGTLAVVMIVYGGIKYAVSAGNVAQQSDAKNIITSAIWGMVLLAGAYLILYTINPELVSLKNPGVPPIPAATSSQTGNPLIDDRITAARKLLNHAAGSGDCGSPGKTSSFGVLTDVINGNLPMVCSHGCTPTSGCSPGGGNNINLDTYMLERLVDFYTCISGSSALASCVDPQVLSSLTYQELLGLRGNVSITSITGGSHATTSRHYKGKAVDLVVSSNNPSVWDAVVDLLKNREGGDAWCEDPSREITEQRLSNSCEQNIFSGGSKVSGAHIHAQW